MKKSVAQHLPLQAGLKKIYHSLYFTPFIIFTAIMLITYGAWRASQATLHNDVNTAITTRTSETEELIKQRLSQYEQIITGGAGLIRASQDVTKSEWADYVRTFKVDKNLAGAQSIGYIRHFGSSELPAIISYMQQQGVADFKLIPDTPRDLYTAVIYAEPAMKDSTIGLDYFTDPEIMKAMAKTRDTDSISITQSLKPVISPTDQPVILMFAPQYEPVTPHDTTPQRQQSIRGYIYAVLKTQDFIDDTISSMQSHKNMLVSISSEVPGENPKIIYESPNFAGLNNNSDYIQSEQTIGLYGQTWKLKYTFKLSSLVRPQRQNLPKMTFAAGFIFAILLAEVIFLLLKARANDLGKQRDQAVELAKDELLSLASHQLRTPATTVKQYLGMVLQGFAGDITQTQNSLLTKAYDGNERQLYIINEMLHIAKIDSGRIVLAKKKTDIVKLVKEITADAQSDIDKAKHKLVLNLPKQAVYIRIDEHMLRMAIENIVSNAIKYTLPGGKIYVSVKKDKSVLRITIKDSGIGIEQKDFQKLYKLFTRLDNIQMQNVSGTGVGLYLAKHLILLHKGRLSLTSTPGKGSSFMITLPLSTINNDKL